MRKIIKWIVIILIILFCVGIFTEDENENTRNHSTLSSLGRGEGSSVFSAQELRNKQVVLKGDGKDKVTVLVYMNGSDLETESQEATTDLKEIVNASDSENVKIVVQTMGTKTWSNEYGIASDRTQRYLVDGSNLKLVDDSLSQLDCTIPDTLGDFIKWGATNYPADRYILLFWNHGGGPVYGYGYDEYLGSEESLTIDEIQTGLKNGGIYFDFIGMDCCLMSSIEVCCALYDYCDYTILSEDFESGYGWNYTGWISKLTSNPSISTEELAKIIIDDTIKANEEGDLDQASTLALIDESYMKILYTAWTDFAYKNLNVLTEQNYSTKVKGNRRALPKLKEKGFFSDWLYSSSEEYNMEDYYITDLMALAENIDSEESKALSSAMKLAIVYFDSTSTEKLTGISVTLPYGDMEFYQSLSQIFLNCGFDNEYVSWLENFVSSEGNYNFYDYDSWYDDWEGWDNYEEEYDLEDWYYWNDNHEFEDEFDWDNWDYYDDEDYWDWEFEDEDIWYDGHGDYRDDYRYEEEEYYDDDFWNFWW